MSCIPVHALYFVMISLIQSSLQSQSEACLNNGLFYGGRMSFVPNGDVVNGAQPPLANERVFIFRMPPSFFTRNKRHSIFGRAGRGRIWMKYNTPCVGSQLPSTCPEMMQNQHGPCLDTTVPCSLTKPSYKATDPLFFDDVSPTTISVSWPAWNETKDIGNGPIVGYNIHIRKFGEDNFVTVPKGMQLHHQFMNLTINTGYEFQISVIRDHPFGEGRPSNIQQHNTSDNTPIEAGCPDDITTNAIVDSYSTVDFTVNCTDSVDTYIVPKCNATKNETLFPVGSTTVTCLCQDQSENVDNCSFSVTVNDAMPPDVVCPIGISTNVTGFLATGAAVNFTVPCRDNIDVDSKSKCNATENVTQFPVGVTKVFCTCRDAAGNLNNCSFKVTVKELDIPSVISVYPNGTTAVNLPPEVSHKITDYRLEYKILNTTKWKPYEGTGQNRTLEEGYTYDFRIGLKYNDTHDHTKILKAVTIPCRDIEIKLNVSSSSLRKGMASIIANWTFRNLTSPCSVTNQTISVIPMDLDNCTVLRDHSNGVETTLRDDKRSYTRRKLRANTKYNVTLTVNTKFKSYNAGGEFRTRGTAPSAPPSGISASSNIRARQLDIRWNEPPCGKRNSKIQSYKVEMQNRRGIEVHTFEGTRARYAGFNIGEEYVVRVSATNSYGSGPFSSKFEGKF